MALQRLSFFCLCFLSAVVSLRAQTECDMIEAIDIGSSTPSTDGFIALLLGGADAAARPTVSVSNVEVISLAVGTVQNMFRWASVFATYECSGMLCPAGTYPRTDQFEVECVESTPGNPIWTDSNLLSEERSTPMNPNLTSANLRRDCSICLSPEDEPTVGVSTDPVFHCAACDASCLTGNDGLGYCTGTAAENCCNVYQPNSMGVNICAVNCDMGYEADCPDFICERRCPVLSNPTNGQVSHPARTVGSVATYTCDGLFEVASGDTMRTCQSNSTWDGTAAVCSDCPRLDDPANGMVTLSGLSVGSTASYTCNDGYFVNGADARTCQGPGWSSGAPTCDACDTKYENCKECTPDACTECNDGFELDGTTGECNSVGTTPNPAAGITTAEAVGIAVAISLMLGFIIGMTVMAAIVYCYMQRRRKKYSTTVAAAARRDSDPQPMYDEIVLPESIELKSNVAYGHVHH